MNTHAFIALAAACLLLAGCNALRVQSSDIHGDEGWTTEGESPLRANAVTSTLRPPLEERWKFDAGAGFGAVSPLIIDEIVFVATRKGEVHAINLETGRRVGQATFGESIEGTPVYDGKMLFIPVGWGRRALVGYDLLRGSSLWKVKGASINAGLLTYGGVVIAADDEGHVRAYDKTDGNVVWEADLGDDAAVTVAPVLAGGLLMIADDRGRIAALDPEDGSLAWSTSIEAPVLSTSASDGKSLYVSTSRGRLVKLRVADGTEEWTFALDSEEPYFASPAVSDGQVVFGASDGLVRALDAETGALAWSTSVKAAVTAAPLLTVDVVYVGSMESQLIALERATGEKIWEQELGGRMKSGFASAGNRLVVLAEPKTVYMFETTAESYALGDE